MAPLPFFPEAASDEERKHDQKRIHYWEVDQVRGDRAARLAFRVQCPDPFPEEQHRQDDCPIEGNADPQMLERVRTRAVLVRMCAPHQEPFDQNDDGSHRHEVVEYLPHRILRRTVVVHRRRYQVGPRQESDHHEK